MVKPRKKGFSLRSERFFKVFLPDQSSQRMILPPAFLKKCNGSLPFKSTIITPTKSSWKVDLEKVGDNLYFHKGWEQFVQHHSLEYGDFLVFVYSSSNAIFHVKIYGRNGCEKKQSGVSSSLPKENQLVTKQPNQGSFKKCERALEEASSFKSDFPFFNIVMHLSYINRGNLNIPGTFIKKHMIGDTQDATLVYSDKSWSVKVPSYAGHTTRKISVGSRIFLRDNALKSGDVCIFELVDISGGYIFKVSIFRC